MTTGTDTFTTHPAQIDAALARVVSRAGALMLAFQPIVDLVRGTTAGFEVLARFPPLSGMNIERWFAEAGARGLSGALESRIVRAALTARDALPGNTFLSVNLTPGAVLTTEVQDALMAAGDLRGVVLEITEQNDVDDYGALLEALTPARRRGALIAVDDAGSGYASLHQISTLRPEFVKVDGGLVAGLDDDPARVAVVESLGLLASHIDAWLIAEGIERTEEIDALMRIGVPLGQGYALGRPGPGPADEASALAPYVRGRSLARSRGQNLLDLATRAPTATEREGWSAVLSSLRHAPRATHVVVLDDHQRPVAVCARDDVVRDGPVAARPPLCVGAAGSITELARRAMARPVNGRFSPAVCCDAQGGYLGVIAVERLVEALAA